MFLKWYKSLRLYKDPTVSLQTYASEEMLKKNAQLKMAERILREYEKWISFG